MHPVPVGRAWPALIALLAAGSLLLAACGGGAGNESTGLTTQPDAAPQGGELPTVAMPALWAWGDAEQLGTLVASADVVFSGTVVRLEGQSTVRAEAGGGEPTGPVPRFSDLPVSKFEVRVDSLVSGSLTPGTALTLEQLGGVETRPDGTRVRIALEGDEPYRVGQKYLFFASFQEDGGIAAAPFGRMKVRPDGSLVAEPGWEHLGALEELSRRKLGDAERHISVTAGD